MGLMDKLKGARHKVEEKVGETVAEHGDKIESGIDKAAGFVNDKTGGKYQDKIEGATGKAKDALGKLDDGGEGGGVGDVPGGSGPTA